MTGKDDSVKLTYCISFTGCLNSWCLKAGRAVCRGWEKMKETGTRDIACQQVLTENGSVYSVQWTLFPERFAGELTPQFIMHEYLAYLRRFTLSLARPVWTDNGLEFRFLSTKIHLLTFAPPFFSEEGGARAVTLRICGGPFVQYAQCNRGKFSFLSQYLNGEVRVTVRLEEYFPRLLGGTVPSFFRKILYRLTQAALHRSLTTRFLAALYRDVTGDAPRFRIVAVDERRGEAI